ncbi:MAG TPA: hypothetical protein VI485_06370 [Vicinamibacterales bacterium]|nr:hypothetical protein [Vicinamibacterales bacterium]
MSRGLIIGIVCVVALIAAAVVGAGMMWSSAVQQPRPAGAAVTVLVDFSKSFIPEAKSRGAQGLIETDRSALHAVAEALARLAWEVWIPPVKIVWSPITAGPTVAPFCEPLMLSNTPIKKKGEVSGLVEIEQALVKCVDEIARAAKDPTKLAPYTDISAAVAGASTEEGAYADRFLVVLSDFREHLPPGHQAVQFKVPGQRVILLHRPGTDEPEAVPGYLARIDSWKERFRLAGASGYSSLPVFAASRSRVQLALRRDPAKAMTSLTIVLDPNPNLFRTTGGTGLQPDGVLRLARALAEFPEAQAWNPPITTQWAVVNTSGLRVLAERAIDFDPTILIPKPGEISGKGGFRLAMEELAQRAFNVGKGLTQGKLDLSGSLGLLASVEPAASSHIVVILSDFATTPAGKLLFQPNSQFALIHVPGRDMDENTDATRRDAWRKMLTQQGAKSVCMAPLATWTPVGLSGCVGAGRPGSGGNKR